MLLHEKIELVRKMDHLTQEEFADELGVSRQAVSKWESGTAVPSLSLLVKLADRCNLTLDQLAREDFDLAPAPWPEQGPQEAEQKTEEGLCIQHCLGSVCDVSMNSFRYSVLRGVQIVGMTGDLVCFIKKNRYGYFNRNKALGILVKERLDYTRHDQLLCGKCTVYVNRNSYWGGQTYLFSSIEEIGKTGLQVQTGRFTTQIPYKDVSVIMMADKISAGQ